MTDVRRRYSRKVIASGQSPWDSRNELDELAEQLRQLRDGLADELKPTKQNLAFRADSSTFSCFVMLHAHHYQITCDLYRFLVPFRRESVSTQAWLATPTMYINHCQQQCLYAALQAVEFIATAYDTLGRKRVDDCFFGVIAYHMTLVISTLRNYLPPEKLTSVEILREQLAKVLQCVQEAAMAHDMSKNCVSNSAEPTLIRD